MSEQTETQAVVEEEPTSSSSSSAPENTTSQSNDVKEVLSETKPHSCPFMADQTKQYQSYWKEGYPTMYEHLLESVEKYRDRQFLGNRVQDENDKFGDYHWLTFGDMWNQVQNIGSALWKLGLKKNDRVGIMSITCTNFNIMDICCMAYGLCSVPLYTTLAPDAVPYIINHSNCKVVFVSVDYFPTIYEAAKRCPNLKAIIVFGHKVELLAKRFQPRDFSPIPRTEEDDRDYFIETYDPTNPKTLENGKDEAPDYAALFKQFAGADLVTSTTPSQSSESKPDESSSSSSSSSSSEKPEKKKIQKQGYEATESLDLSPDVITYRLFTFDEMSEFGSKNRIPSVKPSPDDVLSIMYTSGTTGTPKGVILHHENLISTVTAGFNAGMNVFTPDDTYYTYLPLAHVFERLAEYVCLTLGVRIGFFSGNTKELVTEINILKPSLFVGVPRIMDRIYESYVDGVNKMSGCARYIFDTCLEKKKQAYRDGALSTPWLDKLVFNKTKEKLGGKLIFILCGSAPFNPKVHEYMQCVLGVDIICGYSMTETTCSGAVPHHPNFRTMGHCGRVMSSLEMKLRSVPEMGYSAEENKGEILMRGPAVFHGYYRDPWQSRAAFTEDGWVMSGDIGTFDEEGNLYVIDRKKNIFKLSQGEYVAPEVTEAIYLHSPYIEQSFVHGLPTWRYCVALVCPRKDETMKWVAATHPEWKDLAWEEILQKEETKKMIQKELNETGKQGKLASFQMAKNIKLIPQPFSDQYVTPSLKLKRFAIREAYKTELQECYDQINQQ